MKIKITALLEKLFSEHPSRPDNAFVGIFELAMGLFLFLPFQSFAPTLKLGIPNTTPVFGSLQEWQFAAVMVILGASQILLASTRRWNLLRKLALPTIMFWAFITVGYYLTLPTGTAIVTSSVFTLWVTYQYLELSYWTTHSGKRYLPNNRNIGNI